MLAMFLLVVSHNTRYCLIRKTFGRLHYNTSQNFNKVLKALKSIAVDMMVKPGSTVPEKIRENTRFYPYFKDCIEAIDEFIYVLSGWEGSAHDSLVLTDALSKYFLVDGGYPNRRQFLAPFRGVRYHLQEFTGQGRHPENAKELFNLRHASLRNAIERIFGIFKSRFKIFKAAPPFPYTTQAELVLACAGLHNFLRRECHSDEFSIELDNEVPSSSSEQVYEDDNFDQLFSQEQQRANVNSWRESIANQM
ncbi:uncharacterized protein LOC122005316 [Zingiber officinale]|uniref:uncharacterized protein LOC122005316 n=1 Tax=Zingiber officinale TaxID=94328 RepID=UPI001C4B2718|nr:uncharacterized protein LOC122005316 [Zingiber officinale]